VGGPYKIVVIGAGSAGFTPPLVADLVSTPAFADSSLTLVDTQASRLPLMERVARQLARQKGAGLQVTTTTDRRSALDGAHFVITTFAVGGLPLWREDIEIPRRYGIEQTTGDTVGPGGLFRALRHIPIILEVANDMAKLCPAAWLINLTNPLSTLCRAVTRETSIKTIGLCHGIQGTGRFLADYLRRPRGELQVRAAGINHLTWVTDLRDQHGLDLYPELRRQAAVDLTPPMPVSFALLDLYGYFPSPGDIHVDEFYGLFLRREPGGELPYGLHLNKFYADEDRRRREVEALTAQANGQVSVDALLGRALEGERIAHVMAALIGKEAHLELAVNIPNDGHIRNLPRQAIVEVPAMVGPQGVAGLAMGALPPAITSTLSFWIDEQERTVDAAIYGDHRAALQVLAADPQVRSIETARALLADFLAEQAPYLPRFTAR
jgi:alpha-galactosidase